jgi:hypothetical protein
MCNSNSRYIISFRKLPTAAVASYCYAPTNIIFLGNFDLDFVQMDHQIFMIFRFVCAENLNADYLNRQQQLYSKFTTPGNINSQLFHCNCNCKLTHKLIMLMLTCACVNAILRSTHSTHPISSSTITPSLTSLPRGSVEVEGFRVSTI